MVCGDIALGCLQHRLKPFIEPWRRNAEVGEFTERGAAIALSAPQSTPFRR
jgi:hypothetical protein